MSNKAKKNQLAKRYGAYCFLCDKKFKSSELQVHHIIPKYAKGTDDIKNLCLLCPNCHCNKVHKYKYGTKEYKETINKIHQFMKRN